MQLVFLLSPQKNFAFSEMNSFNCYGWAFFLIWKDKKRQDSFEISFLNGSFPFRRLARQGAAGLPRRRVRDQERGRHAAAQGGLGQRVVGARGVTTATIWATETSPTTGAARPPRAFTHISNWKWSFFYKSPFFALKRNVKRPCGLQTYIFPLKSQHFWWTIVIFLSLGWSWASLSGRSAPMQRGFRFGQKHSHLW